MGVVVALTLVRCAYGDESAIEDDIGLPGRDVDPSERLPREDGGGAVDADTNAGDGGAGDSGADAAVTPSCDPNKPFGGLQKLQGGFSTSMYAIYPVLTPDELTIYYTQFLTTGDIMRATRTSKTGAFTNVQVVPNIGSSSYDGHASISSDHLSIYFYSTRAGGGNLWMATRASTSVEFGTPTSLPATVNGNGLELMPFYWGTAASGVLYFTSDRNGGYDIWHAARTGSTFATASLVPGIPTSYLELGPRLSTDGLRIVYVSTDPTGKGNYDVWTATRASTSAPFTDPKPIPELNSAAYEYGAWISDDGCRAYVSAQRTGDQYPQLYYAVRPP